MHFHPVLKISAPLGWEHINLTGDYIWDLRQITTYNGCGRSCRVPLAYKIRGMVPAGQGVKLRT